LTWSSGKKTPKDAPEKDLPTLRWKEGLLPPLSVTCQIYLHPGSHMALIGILAGDKRARVGFHTINPVHSTVALLSNDAGGFRLGKLPPKTHFFKPGDLVKVEITVSAEGSVALKYNDIQVNEEYQVPIDKPISVILQSYSMANVPSNPAENDGGMDIQSLSISGLMP
jgi:hypothetical protein